MVGARDKQGVNEKLFFNGYRISVLQDDKILELVHTTM